MGNETDKLELYFAAVRVFSIVWLSWLACISGAIYAAWFTGMLDIAQAGHISGHAFAEWIRPLAVPLDEWLKEVMP